MENNVFRRPKPWNPEYMAQPVPPPKDVIDNIISQGKGLVIFKDLKKDEFFVSGVPFQLTLSAGQRILAKELHKSYKSC